jgi:hypothetical protein
LDRAEDALERLDGELRTTEIGFDDAAQTARILTMEIAEQLAKRREEIAPALRAEVARRAAVVSERLAALAPAVDALLELRSAAKQFEKGATMTGYPVFCAEMPIELVRVLNFFTAQYRGGVDLADLRNRWETLAHGL